MKENFRIKRKLNNKGSAIVTVLIVVLFLSVLATTILYLSSRNYIMKQSERKTVESFYGNETAIEEIKAGFVVMSSEAYKRAYFLSLIMYASNADDEAARRNCFLENYKNCFLQVYNERLNSVGGLGHETDLIKSFVSDPSKNDANVYSFSFVGGVDTSMASSSIIRINGISVTYKNAKSFTSEISTDFAIVIPDIEGDENINSADFVKYVNWVKE